MFTNKRLLVAFTAFVFLAGVAVGSVLQRGAVVHAQGKRVFELRTYTAPEGKLDALNARFRDHTLRLFQRQGMTNVGYFVPQDAPRSQNTLIYLLAHKDRETAKQSWAAFSADPDWQAARKASEADGRITERVESIFLDATDYSPMK
jgi:hypothetical protein